MLNTRTVIAPGVPEDEHFLTCGECGQAIDLRKLGDVLHHEEPGHAPLPAEPALAALRFIPPQMPSLADEPPDGDGWMHEIKYDGYRTQIHVDHGQVRAYTRNAFDWTESYDPLVRAAERLPCTTAIIDGEVIVQDEQGRSDFTSLRSAIAHRPADLVFMAFDLMHLDGRDLRKQPIELRRAALVALIGPADPAQPIHFSEELVGQGAELFAAADAMGLEGIVSKKLRSRYVSGHGKGWLKIKTFEQRDYLVVGTERGNCAPVALLASEEEGELKYGGGAMITLPQPLRDRFWQRAERLKSPEPPLPMVARKDATWLKPGLRVRVKTLRGEELARHATVTAIL
jgi:DNA ligase D-like protein (predicted ligase)